MKKWLGLLILFGALSATEQPWLVEEDDQPWLTGTLLAPPGTVTPYGSFSLQPIVFYTVTTGKYNQDWHSNSIPNNFNSLNPEFYLYFGLTPWCDINIAPQFYYNFTNHQQSCQFGDFLVGFDFQLMDPSYTPYFPGIQLSIREVFPTGNYEKLNPKKLFSDLSGLGAFSTQFDLILYKVYPVNGSHWLSTTVSIQYTVSSLVHVHGFNAYGGNPATNGIIRPGSSLQTILSFEYSLSKNWALALDSFYQHTNQSTFSGKSRGEEIIPPVSQPLTFTVGSPSSEQFSLAPAIEYNFNSQLGVIGGIWFSVLGRNTSEFISGVFNVTYSY